MHYSAVSDSMYVKKFSLKKFTFCTTTGCSCKQTLQHLRKAWREANRQIDSFSCGLSLTREKENKRACKRIFH